MIHLGDITKISGYTAPVVDCVIGGSPCQDLSIAGKRAGLEGQRSGLFMEQIRIIKEMRENDRRNGRAAEYVRPRYMVWENVPGAFSSNKGEDFRVVLEEVARIIDEGVSIPRPPKGKWRTTGVIIGDGYSIAWRVFDAQYWGIPQRRRRICLVADFNGYTAPQIVFSEDQYYRSTKRSDREPSVGYIGDESRSEVQSFCESLSGDSEPGESEWKGASSDTERSSGASDCERPSLSFQERGGKPGGGKGIIIQEDHMAIAYSVENHPADSRVDIDESGKVQTLTGRMGTGGGNVPMVVVSLDRASYNQGQNAQFDIGISEDGVAHTCIAKGPGAVAYAESINGDVSGILDASYYKGCGMRSGVERGVVAYWDGSQTCGTLTANNAGGNQRMPDKDNFNCVIQDVSVAYDVDCRNASVNTDTNGTLQAKESGGTSYNLNNVVITTHPRYIERKYKNGESNNTEGFKALCLLWKDYGEKTICEWMSAILERIQQADVLQQGMYEEGIQGETSQGYRVDDSTLPCPKLIAKWLLRDMRKQSECGCSSQGRESTEQLNRESTEAMHKLPYKDSQSCEDLLDMWSKGEGLWILRQALSEIQKIWKPTCGQERKVCYIVRRLTPLEAERLQGYPDGWTDIGEYTNSNGKKCKASDASRYKALGNSIALPSWKWVLKRICGCYERDATMASLFDGISGFIFLWTQINGIGSVKWTSEIDEFPMAVCRTHFGDDETGEVGDFYEAILGRNKKENG